MAIDDNNENQNVLPELEIQNKQKQTQKDRQFEFGTKNSQNRLNQMRMMHYS